MLSFSFGNTLFNVVAGENTLVFDTVTVTVPEGYYPFAAFVTYVNTELMADVAFVANLGGNPTAVVLSGSGDEADWTIGTNVLQGGEL